MRMPLLVYILFYMFYPFPKEPLDLQDLLKRAANNDKTIFASEYLSEAFSHWQKHFHFESFIVDSIFEKGVYDEVWLSNFDASQDSNHRIALLLSRNPTRKIVDVRRLLVPERGALQPIEHEVLELIEHFAWLYETGVESFLYDFLYPAHIKIRYEGLLNKNEILERLKSRFKGSLPIQSIEWEGNNYLYTIRLVVGSPLKPIEITVDIQKHITARFFELEDRFERVQALRDSIKMWLECKEGDHTGTNLIVTAPSARDAIGQILRQEFKDFDILVLNTTETSATIEATLPAIDGLVPVSLRYQLTAKRFSAEKFLLNSSWIPIKELQNESFFAHDAIKKKLLEGSFDAPVIYELSDNTLQRYSTLGLPAPFQPKIEETDGLKGWFIIHHTQVDTLQWQGMESLANILNGLTQYKLAYFFFRDIAGSPKKFKITGYALWRDKQRLWHHVAKIREIYHLINGTFQFKQVIVDLYPFIRMENVQALFAEPDTSSYRREKFKIKR
ncbi:MAG: hypothetical protein ACE5JB_10630 [bacterium]